MLGICARREAVALAVLVWLLPAAAHAQAGARSPDVDYRERRVLTVPSDPAAPLTEDIEVSVTYLSARATAENGFAVYEQYFNRVSGFEAEVDGRALRRRQFRTTQAQSEDVFLSGGTIHSFALPDPPRVGQTVRYRYRRTYPDAGYLPILHVPAIDRLGHYEVVVRHPAAVEVAFDVASPRGEVPYTLAQGAGESTLRFAGLAPAADVPLLEQAGVQAGVQIRLRGPGRDLTPTTPESFAAWYGALVARVDTAETPRLRAVAESLRRATPVETIAAIHDYVRSGVRYVADARGESAFVPRAPDLVLQNAYGDCKDRAWLVSTLARLLGHRVDVVLTSLSPAPPVPGVGLGLYDHVVCAFDDGERRIYFDPTHPHLPFGSLSDALVGARSLRIGPDGAEDLRLAPQDSLPALDVTIALDLDRPGDASATLVLRHDALGAVRAALARGSTTDAANAASALAGAALYRVRLARLVIADEQPDAITFQAQADLSQFVVASPTRRYLPLTPFPAVPTDAPARRGDALPLDLPARANVRLRLDLPGGAWTAEPHAVAWGGPEAGFDARLDAGPDGHTVSYHFWQRARHLAGPARDAYLDLAERYLGARREVLTFRSPSE